MNSHAPGWFSIFDNVLLVVWLFSEFQRLFTSKKYINVIQILSKWKKCSPFLVYRWTKLAADGRIFSIFLISRPESITSLLVEFFVSFALIAIWVQYVVSIRKKLLVELSHVNFWKMSTIKFTRNSNCKWKLIVPHIAHSHNSSCHRYQSFDYDILCHREKSSSL